MKAYQPASVRSASHVGEGHLESAISEATVYGASFPVLSDGRTIDIKKLAAWTYKALRDAGFGLSQISGAVEETPTGGMDRAFERSRQP
jgi:hypothetical protein